MLSVFYEMLCTCFSVLATPGSNLMAKIPQFNDDTHRYSFIFIFKRDLFDFMMAYKNKQL